MITVFTTFRLPKPITRTEPSLTYFDSPVVVDNVSHEILSDA